MKILKEAPDKYGLPTDDELSSEADRIRREYDQKIKDLYANRDSQRKEIKLKEFNEVLNKLNSNPALEKLKNQITNNEILKFNITDKKSGLMASSFGSGWINFDSNLPEFKYIDIKLRFAERTSSPDKPYILKDQKITTGGQTRTDDRPQYRNPAVSPTTIPFTFYR